MPPRAGSPLEGLEPLTLERLEGREEPGTRALALLLRNARYWLIFEVASFEPLLRHTPAPLLELGVGLLLRYGEDPAGRLELRDIEAARLELAELPPDLAAPLERALGLLARGVITRDALPSREREGFRAVRGSAGVSAFALRAAGSAAIEVAGHPRQGRLEVELGEPLLISATDERGRPLPPPEVSSKLGAPVWLDDLDARSRRVLLAVPGTYTLQVPGRAGGSRTLLAL